MMDLVTTLTKRQAQVDRDQRLTFSELAANVAGKKKIDPDAVLDELTRLNKTPEELSDAVELLNNRRGWYESVQAGEKAERDYPAVLEQIANGESQLKEIISKHHESMAPIHAKKESIVNSIMAREEAKRRLIDTAGRGWRDDAVFDLDQEIQANDRELATLTKRIEDRQRWIAKVRSLGSQAATSDQEQMQDGAVITELRKWKESQGEMRTRQNDLQSQRNKAMDAVLKPECI